MGWTIKQMAKLSGISTDSLRYYDKLGIISPKRNENGYRMYDEKDLFHLQYVTVMKYARFSLAEIKTIIGLFSNEPSQACNDMCKSILSSKVEIVSQIIGNYQNILQLLKKLIPMIDCMQSYERNQSIIDEFVQEIYGDIQKGNREDQNESII